MYSYRLTILIQLDACRHDYINENNTPFLFNLKTEKVSGSLIPTFGFEPDAAYISGLYPDETNGGAQFWYDPNVTPLSSLGGWTQVINLLPDLPDRVLRRLLKLISKRIKTARIPYHLLKFFSCPTRGCIDGPKFAKSDTVFELLQKAGRTWLYHGFPKYRVDMNCVAKRVERDLFPSLDFAFLHIGDLDGEGHQHGPESEEIFNALKRIDKGIEGIVNVAKNRFKEVNFVIMGDHGMTSVNRLLNIWGQLKKLQVRLKKDYLVFFDSTMVRFWFFSDRAEKSIVDFLNGIKDGHILNQKERNKYHLNYSHNKFGDIIFLVDPGVLIYPNFYQNKKPVKGMHGYAPETPDQQSALLIHSPNIMASKQFDKPVDMRRVFPTLLDLMNLQIPESTTAKSLLC